MMLSKYDDRSPQFVHRVPSIDYPFVIVATVMIQVVLLVSNVITRWRWASKELVRREGSGVRRSYCVCVLIQGSFSIAQNDVSVVRVVLLVNALDMLTKSRARSLVETTPGTRVCVSWESEFHSSADEDVIEWCVHVD